MMNVHMIRRKSLRVGQRIGKFRIEKRISEGPFAVVYRAYDTIEGTRVALKIPHPHLADQQFLDEFRKEVRIAARLDHPRILSLKSASIIDGYFVMVFPLADRTLADRLQSRLSIRTALDYAEQILEATAYAHGKRIIHCDIKPENFLIFSGHHIRLSDFGIAKISLRTIKASGSGTIGFIAPEQAMGKPSLHSDVFSLGLILYRMFSGSLPEWPYEWPPPGYDRLKKKVHPDLVNLIRKAMHIKPTRRYRDAEQMLADFRSIKRKALRYSNKPRKNADGRRPARDWEQIKKRQFQRAYGKTLSCRHACHNCGGPLSEFMHACPWCGVCRKRHKAETSFPASCPRCGRGVKLDWRFCPWCYGPGFRDVANRAYSDRRYTGKCSNPKCTRKELMPFMRYCPWCHRKVRRKWEVPGSKERCPGCGWGVVKAFWTYCPWCGRPLNRALRK
jgi:serine/threonine-protein kinase